MYHKTSLRIVTILILLFSLVTFLKPVKVTALPENQGDGTTSNQELRPLVIHSIKNDLSPALRDMSPKMSLPEQQKGRELPSFQIPREVPQQGQETFEKEKLQDDFLYPSTIPAPLLSFDGVTNLFGGWPPDTQGDVGPNHYVQWINLHFAVWQLDKVNNNATMVYGPVPGNTLFQGFGGDCETTNDGDPITLYDPFADRWFMSQFALKYFPDGPFYQCLAVSQTSDPTGAWYRYQFQMPNHPNDKMNDYPKFGVWPDAYYMSVNQFASGSGSWAGAGVAAFERSAILSGTSADVVYFDLYSVNNDYGGLLPADFDGLNQPAAGAPGYFMAWDDANWIGPQDALFLWEFDVDWSNPGGATFGINGNPNQTIPTASVDPSMCGYSRNCIPQPGTTTRLDAISDRLMYRLQYRNFGDYETLVSNHTVDADSSDHAGIHWFEVRRDGGSWSLFQDGVYAPDADQRWMGSAAMDVDGNIALGYSVSSSTTYPSVRYTGRLSGDPLGTLPQGEASLVAGGGSQTGGNRWGDYSMMAVDPVDDCTFWYTQQYVETTGSSSWKTRIGAFRFPSCTTGPKGTLEGTVTNSGDLSAISGAQILATDDGFSQSTISGQDGTYGMELPVNTYQVQASAFGYYPETVNNVDIIMDTVTTLDFALDPAAYHTVSGVVSDAVTGWPLYAQIEVLNTPLDPIWTNPQSGAYSLSLPEGITMTLQAEAFVAGYLSTDIDIGPLTGDEIVNITLTADPVTCNAPGYHEVLSALKADSCVPQAGGLVVGNVYDDNLMSGLVGATVSNQVGGSAIGQATPADDAGADGLYTLFCATGTQVLTATQTGGYGTVNESVDVLLNDTIGQDFDLPAGWLVNDPAEIVVTLDMGDSVTEPLTISNQGGLAAQFEFIELEQGHVPLGPFQKPQSIVKPFKSYMSNTRRLKIPPLPPGKPLAAGEVIRQWTPEGMDAPWGTAFDAFNDTIWVSSPTELWGGNDILKEYSLAGSATGRSYAHEPPHIHGPADMAYNWNTDMLWMMNINSGTANCIYEIDPVSGYTGAKICPQSTTGFTTSQRGLAYDPETDTWFAGGWNDMMIYRFDSQGNILNSVNTGLAISGLAYNPRTEHLFAMVNGNPNPVYVLDAANGYAVVGQFTVSQGFGEYSGAGLEFDCNGSLWAVDQGTHQVTQFESGETPQLCDRDITWLSTDPITGTITAPGEIIAQVGFDAGVPEIDQPGSYLALLKVYEDTPYVEPQIPVTMTVNAPANWGKLYGTVRSLGYCDQNPAGLADAEIVIESAGGITTTLESKAAGSYQYWLAASGSPYSVNVQAADHIAVNVGDIQITEGGTTQQDFDLRWLKPCVKAQPGTVHVELMLGSSTTVPITLSNTGPVSTPFEIGELNLGASRRDFSLQIPSLSLSSGDVQIDAKEAPDLLGRMTPAYDSQNSEILLDEGFEGGVVPPQDWSAVSNNLNTWEIDTQTPHSGSFLAHVFYDFNQDEWLLSPELNLADGVLSFWSYGSLYWCKDTYDNCDLNIWLVVGDIGGGDDVYVGKADNNWSESWTWTQSVYDLEDKLTGTPMRIGFQYSGNDGAEVGLDDILLDGNQGDSIPWVNVEPPSGTLPAQSNTQQVDLIFDANVPQPYPLVDLTGKLIVNTQDPIYGELQIPITLTLESEISYLLHIYNLWHWGP